jgi:hypothetical protein
LLLLITVGSLIQKWNLLWGLTITEIFLILLPSLLLVRLEKKSIPETLRLRWPGWQAMLLGLFIGIGMWSFSIIPSVISLQVFGYTPPQPFIFPTQPVEIILFFAVTAVLPALCEETMFRGVVLRSYEKWGPWTAFWAAGLLFAFYHLRLEGLLPILPIALALGYLVLRTNSIFPAMLAHFVFNSISNTLSMLNALQHDWFTTPLLASFILMIISAGVILGIYAIVTLQKKYPMSVSEPTTKIRLRWVEALPLAGAVCIYLFAAGLEFTVMKYPEWLVNKNLTLQTAPWDSQLYLAYNINDALGNSVGNDTCLLTPNQDNIHLGCQIQMSAYAADQANSHYQSNAYTSSTATSWNKDSLDIIKSNQLFKDSTSYQQTTDLIDHQLNVKTGSESNQTLDVPENAFLMSELPWRLMALDFSRLSGTGYTLTIAMPEQYDEQAKTSHPALIKAVLMPRGKETVTTPAGTFQTYKVELSYPIMGGRQTQTLWYDLNIPHRLVKYNNGMETYLLQMTNPK